MRRKKKKTFQVWKMVLGFALSAVLAAFQLAGQIYDYQDSVEMNHLPPAQAIVCLAGGRGRVTAAGDLWLKYWENFLQSPEAPLPVLYFSGMGAQTHWHDLVKQLRPATLQALKPENVIIEKESANTDANARWLAKVAAEKNWKRIVLLTSTYHIRRAEFIFRTVLKESHPDMQIETLSNHLEPFGKTTWRKEMKGIRVTLIEYFKWIYYQYFWKSSSKDLSLGKKSLSAISS